MQWTNAAMRLGRLNSSLNFNRRLKLTPPSPLPSFSAVYWKFRRHFLECVLFNQARIILRQRDTMLCSPHKFLERHENYSYLSI